MKYTPPTTTDLLRLKDSLGFTGKQMAELAGVAGDQQWRKYTGGAQPRAMSPHIAFFVAARMVLTPDQLRAVAEQMQRIGADVDIESLARKPVGTL